MTGPHDPPALPEGLPEPIDDGAADHLVGASLPPVALAASDGRTVRLDRAAATRTVVYAFPRMSPPGEPPLVADWDAIPGARGCTPQACGFRDHHEQLRGAGVELFGLSTQDGPTLRQAVDRLRLPFALLSDAELALTHALGLPTFTVAGRTLLRRLTMAVTGGIIQRVWYPVFPPDRHAAEVVAWLDDPSSTPPLGHQ